LVPYLFILVGEVLHFMKKEATSRGVIKMISFSRGARQHTSFQYVDDIVKYVKGEEGNLRTIVQLLNNFFI
jgi:hypothetical protein